jgi:alpha-tubulin suppressor-like RCC1 family protein
VAIAAGGFHSLGLKVDGTLWTWGKNTQGQLGQGNNTDQFLQSIPTQVGQDHDWVAIHGGGLSSLGLKGNGSLWGWGFNADGELGLGDTADRNVPTRVGSEASWSSFNWVAVPGGFGFKADGSLWAWGWNDFGQLGLGDTANRLSPTKITSFNAPRAAVIPLN